MKNFLISLFYLTLLQAPTSCGKLGPGDYGYAEKYSVNASQQAVIDAVNRFKREHPEFCYTDPNNVFTDRDDYELYHVYYYYPEKKTHVITWVRGIDSKTSTIALMGTNVEGSSGPMGIRRVNEDMNRKESKAVISEFETRILNPIKAILGVP